MRKEISNSEIVFPDENGKVSSIDFRTEMKNAAERAGLRKIRFHDLRHTFASNFVVKGGNLLSLQKILGHSTINMTLHYAHLAPDFMASEVEVLDFGAGPSLEGSVLVTSPFFSGVSAEKIGDLKSLVG